MNEKEKLINTINEKMKALQGIYDSKIAKGWSENQKKEWYYIYGMIEALEIITNESYVVSGNELKLKEKIKK